jgi:hypothetical protein
MKIKVARTPVHIRRYEPLQEVNCYKVWKYQTRETLIRWLDSTEQDLNISRTRGWKTKVLDRIPEEEHSWGHQGLYQAVAPRKNNNQHFQSTSASSLKFWYENLFVHYKCTLSSSYTCCNYSTLLLVLSPYLLFPLLFSPQV